jgi:hypothetical protein
MVKHWAAGDVAKNMPSVSPLKACITQLGTAVHQLAASNAMAAVRGSKQLRVVLGRPVLEAHTQLVAACAAAVDKAWEHADCDSDCDDDSGAAGSETDLEAADCDTVSESDSEAAGEEDSLQAVVQAWKQLYNTCESQALADSLLSFGSLLCAALPTRSEEVLLQ